MKNVILFLFLVSSLGCYSQSATNDSIYEKVDSMPEFPGGQAEMYKFLADNIKYPNDCIEKGIQGKVYVKYVVMKDGSIHNIEIIKSAHKLLDEEAIRVVKSMPNWSPGTIQGTPVNVYYMLPISYSLSKKLLRQSKN
jgi:periplasmic protein TonB